MSNRQHREQLTQTAWPSSPAPMPVADQQGAAAYARDRQPMIVFDLDGTLLDSFEMSIECHRRCVAMLGLPPVSRETLISLNGPTGHEACEILGLPPHRWPEFEACMAIVDAQVVETEARLFPGVPEMLGALTGKATLCLLTNGCQRYADQATRVTGITGAFAALQGFVPGVTKAMRIADWIARYAPLRVLVVGDRPTDVAAGREVGATTLGVLYGAGATQEMGCADYTARDVGEVLAICQAFCARGQAAT